MLINDSFLKELMEVKYYLEIANKALEKQLENYNNNILNRFNLKEEEVNKLDDFFNKSYLIVIKNLMEHYKVSTDGKRKGNQFDFNINVPVITSIKRLSSNQIEYLTMKYYDIFKKLSLYDLGFNSVKISEKYWPSNRIFDEIKFDEKNYNFSYVLSVSCSIKRVFFNNNKALLLENKKGNIKI